MLTNLFGNIALDTTIKSLLQKIGRFSFDQSSRMRITLDGATVPVTVTSGTISTVTTASVGIGDIGKPASAQLMSQSNFAGGISRNFVRS